MKFVIDRTKWVRGESHSLLLRGDGKQCCIGQVCGQLGVPDKLMLGMYRADSLFRSHGYVVSDLTERNAAERWNDRDFVIKAYDINDCLTTSDSQKESALTAIFAANGHELVFVK